MQGMSRKTSFRRTLQRIEKILPERLSRSANKRNPICRVQNRTYHGQVESGRTAGRPGGVGPHWVAAELFAQETSVPRTLQGIVESRRNVWPEARKSKILCKPNAGTKSAVDPRLTSGLSAVYHRDENLSLFLAADQWTDAFCFCNLFHARHVWECKPNVGTKSTVDERFIRGLSTGRETPFVPDCFPVDRRFFVVVNPFHANHARENCKKNNQFSMSGKRTILHLVSSLAPGREQVCVLAVDKCTNVLHAKIARNEHNKACIESPLDNQVFLKMNSNISFWFRSISSHFLVLGNLYAIPCQVCPGKTCRIRNANKNERSWEKRQGHLGKVGNILDRLCGNTHVSNPKPGHTTGRSVRAAHSGGSWARQGQAGWDADAFLRAKHIHHSCPPGHREKLSWIFLRIYTNKRTVGNQCIRGLSTGPRVYFVPGC